MPKEEQKGLELIIFEGDTPEEMREKLDSLSHDILALRDEIPEAVAIIEQINGMAIDAQEEIETLLALLDRLARKCEAWSHDLANRYTFLVNLRSWLGLNRTEETDD